MVNFFPQYISNRAIQVYFVILAVLYVLFSNKIPDFFMIVIAATFMLLFFGFLPSASRRFSVLPEKIFKRNLFVYTLLLHLLSVFFFYFYYTVKTGIPFEYGTADAMSYHIFGNIIATSPEMNFSDIISIAEEWVPNISDYGHNIWIATIYKIVGVNVIVPRIINAIFSAWTCVITYKLAQRHFGEATGRIAGIMCMFFGTFIFYSGLHLKETMFTFLWLIFIERADYMLVAKHETSTFRLIPVFILGSVLFLYRTYAGVVAFGTLVMTLMYSSSKKYASVRRWILMVWVVIAMLVLFRGRIEEEVRFYWQKRDVATTQLIEYRSREDLGRNRYLKYLGGGVAAPFIFVIPLPSFVEYPTSENLNIQAGNLYIRNILGFFVLIGLYEMLKRKRWRNHIILYGNFVYLFMVALTGVVANNRFHVPVMPFIIIWAAYGITQGYNYRTKRWFDWFMVILFVATIIWNFLKLKGRGII